MDLKVKSRNRTVDWWMGNLYQAQVLASVPKPGFPAYNAYATIRYEEANPWVPTYSREFNETIRYTDLGWDQPNYCQHTVPLRRKATAESVFSPVVPLWDYTWSVGAPAPTVYCNHLYRWVSNYRYGFVDGGYELVGSEPDVPAALARAIVNLEAGAIQPVFNIPRAILELKDVPQTLRGIRDILTTFNRLTSGMSPQRARKLARGMNPLTGGYVDKKTGEMKYSFDTQSLPQFLRALRTGAKSVPKDMSRWYNALSREAKDFISALDGSIQDVAKGYLTYAFGIEPTRRDVQALLGDPNSAGSKDGRWFQAQKVDYKRGQRIRVPFTLGPRDSDFPSCGPLYNDSVTGLLYNYHSANGAMQFLNSSVDFNIRPRNSKVASGLAFAEVANDKSVSIPYSERLAYSGGPLSTAYEITPWSFAVDWFIDVGSYLQTLERAQFPVEYRPELKFGSWKSVCERSSTFLPVWKDLRITYQPLAPEGNLGWRVRDVVQASKPTWVEAFQGDVTYERSQVSRLEVLQGAPTCRVPGGYTLAPGAALLAQMARRLK